MTERSLPKKIGYGSLSLPLFIVGTMLSFTYIHSSAPLGAHLMKAIGAQHLPYTTLSIILFAIATFVGFKNIEDRFAKVGMILSLIETGFIALLTIISIL